MPLVMGWGCPGPVPSLARLVCLGNGQPGLPHVQRKPAGTQIPTLADDR